MADAADKFWDEVVAHLQRRSETAPHEGAESDAAFHSAPEAPLSPAEIDGTLGSVLSGEFATWDAVDDAASDSVSRRGVFRGRQEDGPDDAEREGFLNDLRRLASEEPLEDKGDEEE